MTNNQYENKCEISTTTAAAKPANKKKPFFLRWWFILLAIIVVGAVALSVIDFGGKIIWDDMILGEMLPVPPAAKGEIHENSAEALWVDINKISDKQYNDYVEACKTKGFTVDAESTSSSYTAYNAEGYKLSLGHYGSGADMSIGLETPLKMETITWPTSTAGQKLPAPKSTTGKFSYEHDDSFFVYVGKTSKAEYAKYVNACSEKGFNVDYDKGNDYYYAYDNDGWHVSICYIGYKIMTIDIDAPDEDYTNTTSAEEAQPYTTEKDNTDSNGLDPDFKAAMDSYEEFMNEYVEFMKKYNANPNDPGILADYADFMKKYADVVEAFEKWKDEDMTPAEYAYYIEVQARVSKKLLEIAN